MKLLLSVGEGLGNVTQVLPLANVLKYNEIPFDVLNLSNCKTEVISWLFSNYANVIGNLDHYNYDGRVELATTKGVLRTSDRLDIPLINDVKKQHIYRTDMSEVEVYLIVARDLGLTFPETTYDVSLPQTKETETFDFVVHNGCILTNKVYWERKKYIHMKELVERLIDGGYTVACIGAPEEYCGAGVNKTGLKIEDSAALMNNCKFYISNETGTYQIASAFKTPGIVLYTATTPVKGHHPKFNGTFKVVTAGLDCQPCAYTDAWDKCTKSTHNLWNCRDIPVDKVIEEIKNADIF